MQSIPRIHGLVVCVGYADVLTAALCAWLPGLASVTVVSTWDDTKTRDMCSWMGRDDGHSPMSPPILLHRTEAFTRYGASFNKGLAMEEARTQCMLWQDWILFFDADVVPEPNWAASLGTLEPGYLYGCPRLQADTWIDVQNPSAPRIDDDRVGYGYFQLFHSQDPKVQHVPLLDTWWRHAGNADSNFLLSFGSAVREVPIRLWHVGGKHEHWFGKGPNSARQFREMQETRGGLGIHPSENVHFRGR